LHLNRIETNKNITMAKNMYNIDSLTYQPSTNIEWFSEAIFGGKLIEKGRITPITGIKKSTLLNLLALDGKLLQPYKNDCAWTPDELAKLSEKLLEIKDYKINKEQCIDDLKRKRTAHMMKPGARGSELPDKLEEATMALVAQKLSLEIEEKIFTADSSVDSDDFDGVLKRLKDSTEAIKIVGEVITKENVLAEISKVYEAIPEDVLAKAGEIDDETGEGGTLFIAMAFTTLQKARMSLGGVNGKNVVVNPNLSIIGNRVFFMGVELISVKGLGANEIIAYDSSNFILGTDLESDLESVRIGQFPAPNDNKVFIDGYMSIGFVIPFENEVVFYSPDNTAPQGRMAKTVTAPTGGTLDLSTFDISLSESKMKPYVAQAIDVTLVESWLALEQAKEQPRSGVTTLLQNRINELSNKE